MRNLLKLVYFVIMVCTRAPTTAAKADRKVSPDVGGRSVNPEHRRLTRVTAGAGRQPSERG